MENNLFNLNYKVKVLDNFLSEEDFSELCNLKINQNTNKEFNILQNNGPNALQTVFHVHFHIIPKFDDGSGLSIPFRSNPINHDEGKELASKIKNLLN